MSLPSKEELMGDIESLHQHQLDGLRFLHRQYKHQKPGVIVNCPSQCGKTTFVSVFLQTISKLLKDPVLILCNEDDIRSWKETIVKWGKFVESDIIIESSNPNTQNKKFFIKTIKDYSFNFSYLRKKWSIIIVKDDVVNKKMLSSWTSAQSNFKIWLTTVDMLKDLSILVIISSWISPSSNFNADDFASVENVKKTLQQRVWLETFVEDLLYRNNSIKEFSTTDKSQNNISPKILIKNKDATGTKTKRSKRKVCDEGPLPNNKTASVTKNNISCGISNIKQRKSTLNNENIVKPTTSIDTNTFDPDSINVGNISNDNNFFDNESQSVLNFDNALREIIENENTASKLETNEEDMNELDINGIKQDKQSLITCESLSEDNDVTVIKNKSIKKLAILDVLSEYKSRKICESFENNPQTSNANTSMLNNVVNISAENRSIKNTSILEALKDKEIESLDNSLETTNVINTSALIGTNLAKVENKTVKSMAILDVLREYKQIECEPSKKRSDNITMPVLDKVSGATLIENKPSNSMFILEDLKDNQQTKMFGTDKTNDTVIKNELKSEKNIYNQNIGDILESGEVIAKPNDAKEITDKIKELEKSTLKKFKGSLLDSIF